jgi:hypothetical protein
LKDCKEIIGEQLLLAGWSSKLPEDTVGYGDTLHEAASKFATTRSMDTAKIHCSQEPESDESRLDVVFSAARWCRFWGARGHWLEACF